jgi:pectate lyase
MMNFPLFIEKKIQENGYFNFKWDINSLGEATSGQLDGFYLNTKSFNCWSPDLVKQMNVWLNEWNQKNQDDTIIKFDTIDMEFDDDRIWHAHCNFYPKNYTFTY